MGIIDGIKGFFRKEKEVDYMNCSLCQCKITQEDKVKIMDNRLVHKSCFKRAKKMALSGNSPETIVNTLKNGTSDM